MYPFNRYMGGVGWRSETQAGLQEAVGSAVLEEE